MASADQADWLLRSEDAERAVPVSSRMAMDDEFWRATIERFDLSDGFRVFLTSAEVHRRFVFDTRQAEPEPFLLSHIPVAGRGRLAFSDGVSVNLDPTRSALFLPAERRGIFTLDPQKGLRHAGLSIRADRVRQLFGDDLPEGIAAMIGEYGPTRLAETSTGVRMRRLAASLFGATLRGPLRTIFMEGVALQLLAMQAAAAQGRRRSMRRLAPKDRRAIEDARSLLFADKANPPTLGALAAKVGLSVKALNAGFRRLYGGTVFEVLRNERLEDARLALATGDVTIKEIAHRMGYAHATNFTAAFARRYAMTPLRYQRERRGRGRDV